MLPEPHYGSFSPPLVNIERQNRPRPESDGCYEIAESSRRDRAGVSSISS